MKRLNLVINLLIHSYSFVYLNRSFLAVPTVGEAALVGLIGEPTCPSLRLESTNYVENKFLKCSLVFFFNLSISSFCCAVFFSKSSLDFKLLSFSSVWVFDELYFGPSLMLDYDLTLLNCPFYVLCREMTAFLFGYVSLIILKLLLR